MMTFLSFSRSNRAGLTLLEMLIVLLILAILAGAAVRSLQPVADQARFEATQQSLEELDLAYLNSFRDSSGSVSYTGFIADVGRLPIAQGATPELQLAELWDHTLIDPFTVSTYDDLETTDTEAIPVAAGWKGPYLRLAPGATNLLDGWANPFALRNETNTLAVSAGDPIPFIKSLGANKTENAGDTGYDRDMEIPGGPWISSRFQGTLPVTIVDENGAPPLLVMGERIELRLYGPLNGKPALLAAETVIPTGGIYSVNVSKVVGPKAIRAIIATGTPPGITTVRESAVRQIVIHPGMNSNFEIVIPSS